MNSRKQLRGILGNDGTEWPAILWLVRHGESAGNIARDRAHAAGISRIDIADRDVDVPLSPRGLEQSRALGAWFANLAPQQQPEVVLVSPYRRAITTAQSIQAVYAASAEKPLIIDERLREKEFGILDRLTRQGIQEFFPGAGRNTETPRQVLSPAAGWRELVRRDPSASQRIAYVESLLRRETRARGDASSRGAVLQISA